LILGGNDFGPWRFEVWDISLPGFDGFIGHDFFAKHVVCIDFPRESRCYRSVNPAGSKPPWAAIGTLVI
jgi:hypothetical protein